MGRVNLPVTWSRRFGVRVVEKAICLSRVNSLASE
jgi:hypothetical protein